MADLLMLHQRVERKIIAELSAALCARGVHGCRRSIPVSEFAQISRRLRSLPSSVPEPAPCPTPHPRYTARRTKTGESLIIPGLKNPWTKNGAGQIQENLASNNPHQLWPCCTTFRNLMSEMLCFLVERYHCISESRVIACWNQKMSTGVRS
jgi:hypothetical protein